MGVNVRTPRFPGRSSAGPGVGVCRRRNGGGEGGSGMWWRLALCGGLVTALLAGAATGSASVRGASARAGTGLVPRTPLSSTSAADPRTILVGFTAPATARGAVERADDRPLGAVPGTRVEVVGLQPGESV